MSRYTVEFKPTAAKQFGKLPRTVQDRISKKIDGLQSDPYPPGVKKLSAREGICRIRVGDYRVLYQVESQRLTILVLAVGPRGTVYKKK